MTAIRGSKRPVPTDAALAPAQKLNTQLNCDIHNRFDIEVVDAKTGEIKQLAQAENVICNQLWTRMLTPAAYFNYIHYGTGTGTPAATDTSLFTFLGYGTPATADDVYAEDNINGVYSVKRKISLAENVAVGSTLTEVGIAYSNSASTLCTHAMLKDMNGTQISISKTNTDIINIYATVFLHFSASDAAFSLIPTFIYVANTVSKGPLAYLLGLNDTETLFSRVVFTTAGKQSASDNSVFNPAPKLIKTSIIRAYNSNARTITATIPRLAVGEGNINGIGTIQFGTDNLSIKSKNWLNLRLGSWFPATNITGESIGTGDGATVDFSTKFPLVTSGKIYIDGIQDTSATIDLNEHANAQNLCTDFECVALGNDDSAYIMPKIQTSAYSSGSAIYCIAYNPNYEKHGIASFRLYSGSVYCSNDLQNWTLVAQGSNNESVFSVDSALQNCKYWKTVGTSYMYSVVFSPEVSATNIHFTTPPAAGAVITADYTTKTIAKDANHVFDLTVTIQLGEPTT